MTLNHDSSEAITLRYQALLAQSHDLITIMSLDGHYIAASQTIKEFFGLTDATLSKHTFRDMLPPEEIPKAEAIYARLLAGEEIPTYERVFIRYDGTPFIGEVNVTLIRDADGKPHEILSILRDLTERRRAEAETMSQQSLNLQLQKEQEINRMRTDLLMKINHEFRTPLAIINTYVNLMEQHFERLTFERRAEYLTHMRLNVHRISEMLDDLYLIYQTQNGMTRAPEPFDMHNLVEGVVAQLGATIGREHRIIVDAPSHLPLIQGYERLLWHSLYNILTNAIDYSPKNSTITISLAHYDAELVIRIVDNGIGIPEKDQGRIFEPFYRGENTVNVQGTGLGLSVVSEAIRTHEGRIELESQLGVGTTMTLRLPIAPM